MGLDDFTGESLSDEERERREKLSKNSPPGDVDSWRQHEPGTPGWMSFISGEKLEGSDKQRDVLVVKIEDVDTTKLKSKSFVDLEKSR